MRRGREPTGIAPGHRRIHGRDPAGSLSSKQSGDLKQQVAMLRVAFQQGGPVQRRPGRADPLLSDGRTARHH